MAEASVAHEVLTREAVYLDERRWDEWLALFAQDCEYWVPTWVSEDRLASDPQRELSHIYYADRRGLEDRIARIRGGKAPSANPLRRTAHSFGNVMVTEPGDGRFKCRSTWSSLVYDPHGRTTFQLFGYAMYELSRVKAEWLIARKKTVLQNDMLPSMIDVYCL